jgi:hypothetical protein
MGGEAVEEFWNPDSAKDTRTGSGPKWISWLRRMPIQLAIWLVVMSMLLYLVLFHSSVNLASLELPCRLTLQTLVAALIAFISFLVLFLLINLIWALVFALLGWQRLLPVTLVAAFLSGLVWLNSAPIAVYLQWVRDMDMAVWIKQLWGLLLANAMMYYFFYGFFIDIHNETKQLYVKSAKFKGATVFNYLREHARMVVLASLSPLFYYMVSFTLFTDFLLQSKGLESGIIGYLFTLVTKASAIDGTNSGFASPSFWAALGVMIAIVIPIKYIFDYTHRRATMSSIGTSVID